MTSSRDVHASVPALRHTALAYTSEAELLDVAVPYLRAGVIDGEFVLAIADDRRDALLREELGDVAAAVTFIEPADFYTRPGPTISGFFDLVHAQARDGRRVRTLGEPPWDDQTEAQTAGWHRYEALLNHVLADQALTALCLYDVTSLDSRTIDLARRSHPWQKQPGDGDLRSLEYLPPSAFCAELDREPLPPPVGAVENLTFASDGLTKVRDLTGDAAGHAGLSAARTDELRIAVNEIATNAVRHGNGRGRLRCWRHDHHMVFEIDDAGTSVPDPMIGHVRPTLDDESEGGYGLWLARQLADLVEIRHGPGWQVRLYMQLRD